MSAINYLNEGRKDRALACARDAGMDLSALIAAVMPCITQQNQSNNCAHTCYEETPATQGDIVTTQLLASKDSKIAQLEAEKETDNKIVALNESINVRFNKVDDKFDKIYDELRDNAVRAAVAENEAKHTKDQLDKLESLVAFHGKELSAQAVLNGVNAERTGCIQDSLRALTGRVNNLTEEVIPSKHICESPIDELINLIKHRFPCNSAA